MGFPPDMRMNVAHPYVGKLFHISPVVLMQQDNWDKKNGEKDQYDHAIPIACMPFWLGCVVQETDQIGDLGLKGGIAQLLMQSR